MRLLSLRLLTGFEFYSGFLIPFSFFCFVPKSGKRVLEQASDDI